MPALHYQLENDRLPKKNGQGFRFQPDKGSVWIVLCFLESQAKSGWDLPVSRCENCKGNSENPAGQKLLVEKQKLFLFPHLNRNYPLI